MLHSGVLTGNSRHHEPDFRQIKFQQAGGKCVLVFFFVLRWGEGQWRHVVNVNNYIYFLWQVLSTVPLCLLMQTTFKVLHNIFLEASANFG